MKKLLVSLLLVSLIIFGCTRKVDREVPLEDENVSESEDVVKEDEVVNEKDNESKETTKEERKISEFSIKVGKEYIQIRDFEEIVDIEQKLGEPQNVNVEVLGTGSDTFEGSLMKIVEYDGLELKFFAPENRFWLMEINVYNDKYVTKSGIKVGDSLEKLKTTYQNISMVPDGRTDENNAAYIINDSIEYNYIYFEVKNAVVDYIKIYHELQ